MWQQTASEIEAHNTNRQAQEGLPRFTMALNQFSDMTSAERQAYLGVVPDEAENGDGTGRAIDVNITLTSGIDYIDTGAGIDWRSTPGNIFFSLHLKRILIINDLRQ